MSFDINAVRAQFPALASGAIFFDNPGGTQVAQRVVERMADYLVRTNANKGGAFQTAVASDAVLHESHAAMAALLNCRPDETVFGQNMTTLTFHVSRALGKWIHPGDEIIVTRLDHDANIAPWLLMAEDRGAGVRWVDIHEEDCTLKMSDFEALLTPKTKIVAVGYASNAVGTINDVKAVVNMAHAVGALVFVDAVQYAPHNLIDVKALDCDFLVCSAYKFFGPHVGILYGKYDLLDRLPAYRVRPAPADPPGKFETGTQNHEGQAGVLGAIEYFEWLGKKGIASRETREISRRAAIERAMQALVDYEQDLCRHLIAGLQTIRGLRIRGLTDPARAAWRVPTVSFTLEGWHPRKVAEQFAEHNLYVWDGNYYALAIAERLGVEEHGGMVRVGLAHYNTRAEVEKLVDVVGAMTGGQAA